MIAQTRCDAVMIGRAAPANPWIFRQNSSIHGVFSGDRRRQLPGRDR